MTDTSNNNANKDEKKPRKPATTKVVVREGKSIFLSRPDDPVLIGKTGKEYQPARRYDGGDVLEITRAELKQFKAYDCFAPYLPDAEEDDEE